MSTNSGIKNLLMVSVIPFATACNQSKKRSDWLSPNDLLQEAVFHNSKNCAKMFFAISLL
jgi:hypothetical protein